MGRTGSAFLAPIESTWEIALEAFTKFFKAKCGKQWRREWPAQSLCRGKTGGDVSYPVAKIGLGTNHRERYAQTVVKGVASNGVAVNWSRQGYHFFR